ncbi:MAG: MFS transporter [Actinophytocola sp.]|nr:MFS transporter [Actinophytocola sp.]
MGSGSDDSPDATHFGGRSRRAGRKSRRKWAPEPGAAPPPTRKSPEPGPPASGTPPTRRQRPVAPPTRWEQVPPHQPVTADQADTVNLRREPPPPRARRPGGGTPPPGAQGFDRYGTDGYLRPPGSARREPRPQPGRQPGQQDGPADADPGVASRHTPPKMPKKITVTRVAAMRGKELSGRAVGAFHRVHNADGADKSGLTSLSYALMLNYASDAALAIALANTLFFSAASAESKWKVALYLLITIAPFALIAPLIGPALDRIQRGRRLAMALASIGQALMCVIIAVNFDTWLLYPAALGKMVLSKSFIVLKSAVTPRVVPPDITLSKTNARLTVFGLAAAGVGGSIASLFSWMADSPGALWFAAAICAVGAGQAMRIPSWVERTEGEVPASLHSQAIRKTKQPIGLGVVVALWGNGTIRLLTGFLMLFAAFAVKASAEANDQSPFLQLLLLGIIGGAAGVGGFLGNALGSRLQLGTPDQIIVAAVGATLVSTLLAAIAPGVPTAAIVALVGSTGSALAKISLDAVIQHDLPEQSRASAFGRSETVLQLAWCFGGAVGLLLPPTYWVGFLVVSILLALGLAQTMLVQRGGSLLPTRAAFQRVAAQAPGRANRASRQNR